MQGLPIVNVNWLLFTVPQIEVMAGTIIRRGVLLLSDKVVRVLGGQVADLQETNNYEANLERLFAFVELTKSYSANYHTNHSDDDDEPRPPHQPAPNPQSSSHSSARQQAMPTPDLPPARKSPAKKKADLPAKTKTPPRPKATPAKRTKIIKSEDGDDDDDLDFVPPKKSAPPAKNSFIKKHDDDDFDDDFGDMDESLLQAVDDIEQGLGDVDVSYLPQVAPPSHKITAPKAKPLPVKIEKSYIPEPPLPKVATTPVAIFHSQAPPTTPQTLADLTGRTGTFIMKVGVLSSIMLLIFNLLH